MSLQTSMFILQMLLITILFCAINIFSLRKGPAGLIQHYPPDVQSHAVLLGHVTRGFIITKEKVLRPCAWAIYSAAVILIIAVLNEFSGFLPLFIQAVIFLEWLNWFDAFILECAVLLHCDKLLIPGTEEMLRSYGPVYYIKKRLKLGLLIIPYSVIIAGIAMLIQL